MEIAVAKEAILNGRTESFTTVGEKDGPSLYRPLMAPCLMSAFGEVEKTQDTRIVAVGVNTRLFAEMRKFNRNHMDIQVEATLLRAGLMATLWGSMVLSFSPEDLGDDELILVGENGKVTRFEVAEGYPHEVKIEVRVTVDAGKSAERTVVVPFAEVEHLGLLIDNRFAGVIAAALEDGVSQQGS